MANEFGDRTIRGSLAMLIEQVDDFIERQHLHSPLRWLGE
jgi:hypothetical protein